MTTYIYRDFNDERRGWVGSISVDLMTPSQSPTPLPGVVSPTPLPGVVSPTPLPGVVSPTLRRVQVTVEGLHQNGNHVFPVDYPAGQAFIRVALDARCDLYRAIVAILDRLTADHKDILKGQPYRDFVLCSDALVQSHPELCHNGTEHDASGHPIGSYMGGPWTEFTPEILGHLTECDDADHPGPQEGAHLLYGEVRADAEGQLSFVYDYPVVSYHSDKRYYELTRGKPVWDVTYQDLYPNPIYTQEIGFIYRDFLMDDALEPVGVRLLFVAADAVEVQATGLSLSATRYGVESHGDLYNTIIEILDNITEEHQDVLQEACYRDYVYCSRNGGDVDPLSCRKYARKDSVDSEDPTHQDLGGGWFVCNDYTVSYMRLPSFP